MILRFADCTLDTGRRTLIRRGEQVPVEPQVFDLILLLAKTPDRLVTRDEMVEAVWGGRIVSESAISARIASARKAVGDDGQRQAVIRTVQRRGLQMAVPVVTGADAGSGDRPEAPRIRYTKTDDGRSLAYVRAGKGPRLLRVPAPPVDLEVEWTIPAMREFNRQIAEHFDYLRYDPPGYGLSDRDDGPSDFVEEAEAARAVADAAGWDRFSIFSESGAIFDAIQLVTRHPERIEKFVILGGYAEGRSLRGEAANQDGGQPDVLHAMLSEGWSERDGGLASAFMLAYFPEGPLEDIRGITRMMQDAASPAKMLSERQTINTTSILDLLPKVACPTLIVHGRRDAVHPLAQAQKLAAGIPDAELLVLETANHLPLPTHPTWATFFPAFLRFLTA